MQINNITQTISTIPPAGVRGVDVQTLFVIKQEDFQDHLQGTTITELNTLKDQLNTRIGEINSTATTMNGYVSTASSSASTATTKAGEASTSATAALASKNQASTFATNASTSATKAGQWADNNYNVEVEAGKYSAKHWSTVAQNATVNKVDKVTSTDNAIVRFDGTTGAVQNSNVVIDAAGNLIITAGSLKGSHGAGNIASNTAIGDGALVSNTTGNYNTASGVNALLNNTTGYQNTASGLSALAYNTTGYQNTASGVNALLSNTTGANNTANGVSALVSNTTGNYNTASGVNALLNNTTGYNNTASGVNALLNNTTGNYNTASGNSALQNNTTGYNNTASGASALQNNTTGYQNTASGVNALLNNTTGYYNTASGLNALLNNTTFSNVSGFGQGSQVTGSNQVQLGDTTTTTYVYGTVQNRSDIRDKADVRDTILGLDFIKSLRPVDYKWDMREDYKPEKPNIKMPETSDENYEELKAEYDKIIAEWLEACHHENIVRDGSKKRTRYHQGFIAQEVKALGVYFGGIQDHSIKGGEDVLSIGYDEIIAPLVKAVQEQQAMIEALKARIEVLEETGGTK